MPEDTFSIGLTNDLYSPSPLSEIFSPTGDVFDPDWSFQDFSASVETNDGLLQGQGFAVAKWRFNHLSNLNRQVLKTLCPGLSAVVYIRTKTNELDIYGAEVWGTFQAVMRWADTDEDKAASETLGVLLTFTHLVLQA